MKLVIIGGPPSVGKTSVIVHSIRALQSLKRVQVVKLDCLTAGDEQRYGRAGIPVTVGLSTCICPDHFLASNLEGILAFGTRRRAELLIVESAGLCNRCSPHLQDTLAVTVLDTLSGIHAPVKAGPLVKAADVVVLTRSDLVSQAEREVFRHRLGRLNRRAAILEINGLTGQNADLLARRLEIAAEYDASRPLQLKFPMPGAVCSFCLGEKRVGETWASGNVKLMEFPKR